MIGGMNGKAARRILLALALSALSGCASVKVVNDGAPRVVLPTPAHIYVAPFSVSGGEWHVRHERGDDLAEFKREIRTQLQQMMLERFPECAPASPVPASLPRSGLLVRGEFTRVEEGSWELRAAVGMGAGGTKVETTVRLYDLARSATRPVAVFQTTGGSNAQPGFVTGGGPTPLGLVGAISSAAMNLYGIEDDLKRTAREVLNYIMHRQSPADKFRDAVE